MERADDMELYLKIGALMEKHNLTNQALADLSGVPIGTISSIRSGKVANPGFDTVCAILSAMGESADALYSGDFAQSAQEPSAQEKMIKQIATVAAQAATLKAQSESITHYRDRVAALEAKLESERRRTVRLQTALVALVVAIVALGAIYIWDVRNLHSGLTAYFNPHQSRQ